MLRPPLDSKKIFKGRRSVNMTKFTYLFVDLFAVLIPFIFSFHRRLKFIRLWKAVMTSIIVTAILFVTWDIVFTQLKVWNFNPEYITGIYFYNIPVEEILFFICIPYACLFTYYCIDLWLKHKVISSKYFSIATIFFLSIISFIYHERLYTLFTFTGLLLLISYLAFIKKSKWLGTFYLSYLFLLLPFFICNGILTGTGTTQPVVIYNDEENLGIRLLTIPLEDIFYGMFLVLMNVSIFEMLRPGKIPLQAR
jgi:lycopene cyclase domain-containing protein